MTETPDSSKKAILLLSDGSIFQGRAIGGSDDGYAIGELVFNTSMSGYQEILTDPSYSGQLVTFTYPHIGNYGANDLDNESDGPKVSGLIVRELTKSPSNQRATSSLGDWLTRHQIVGIEGLDTRALVRRLREKGVMMGVIVHNATTKDRGEWLERLKKAEDYASIDFVKEVAVTQAQAVSFKNRNDIDPAGFGPLELVFTPIEEVPNPPPEDSDSPHIVVIDFGVKWSILRSLLERGARVTLVPYFYSVQQISELKPDGLLISNGPGNPRMLRRESQRMRALAEVYPTFGICLGHQLIAQGFGGETYKLRYGHRGPNQPCLELGTGRVLITSQNHGYAVSHDTIPANLKVTSKNLNDDTISGMRHRKLPIFSVQYHPEAGPGPNDAKVEFDQFLEMVRQHTHA